MDFYLFPGTMYQRALEIQNAQSLLGPAEKLKPTSELYQIAIRQYLGFGWFLQFFPATYASQIRKQFSTELKPMLQKLKKDISELPSYRQSFFTRKANISQLNSYFNMSPVFHFLAQITWHFQIHQDYFINKKMPVKILLSYTPLMNILLKPSYSGKHKESTLSRLIYQILNPACILESALHFFHLALNRLIESGARANTHSTFRGWLKNIIGFAFGVFHIPVLVLKSLMDIPYCILNSLLIKPVAHFITSLSSGVQNRHAPVLIASIKELQTKNQI